MKIYTMDIETAEGTVQHPYHLGTKEDTAIQIVLETLARRGDIITIALRLDKKLVYIYDWRDLYPDLMED